MNYEGKIKKRKKVNSLDKHDFDCNYPIGVIAIDASTKNCGVSGFVVDRDGGDWFISGHSVMSEKNLTDVDFMRRNAILLSIEEQLDIRLWNSIMVCEGLYMRLNADTLIVLGASVGSWETTMLSHQGRVLRPRIKAISWRSRFLHPEIEGKTLALHGPTTDERKELAKTVAADLGAEVASHDEAEAWLLGLHLTIALIEQLNKGKK